MPKKLISFILPIYNEQGNIPKLYEELESVRDQIKEEYDVEYIFVNDASKDKSLEFLKDLHRYNPKEVKVLSFSRNYGHQIAVTAGQDAAKGDAIIIMDSDLQDPPSVSLDLIKKWEEGYDVVYAQRRKYKSNFFKEKSAFLFYRLMARIAQVHIPVDTGDFRLLSKRVNDEMKKYKEKSRFLRGISSLVGFKQTAVLFDRSDRYAGKPGYTIIKSFKLALDGITGFSTIPLRFISVVGVVIALSSIVFGSLYIIIALITGMTISGWASIMSAIYFLGGVQLVMLGILGEYIGRIYIQVLDRPLYTLEEKLD